MIRKQALRRPDAVALRHGERAISYAELDDRSNRLAQALAAAGVGPGDRVAHLDRTAPGVVELLAATSKIGAVTVPLNWRLTSRELATVVADSGAPVLLAGPLHVEVAEEVAATVPQSLRVVKVADEYERLLASHDPVDPGGRGEADDAVLQMYTSGTTGVPKGVLITHGNLAGAVEASQVWMFDDETVSLAPLPMFHVGGIAWTFLGLWNGGCTILVTEFDAGAVLDLIERERVTNAVMVPTVMQLLSEVPGAADRDFSALRSITYGASPITTPVLKAALRTFRCRLFGMYGLTETTGGVIQLDPEDHDPGGAREHLLRSAGKPLPWMEMRVVDPTTGADCAARQVGEVWLRGPNVMAGYHARPDDTAEAITADGWLRTGDGGYLDEEGYLFLTDRIKDMVVTGGENVYPVEVEEALSQHPAVAEVTVIGVPDDRWGEAVKALVVAAPGTAPSADELIEHARDRLAGYKIPRTVDFVTELPRTPTGKVLKRELRDRYAQNRGTACRR